MKNILFAIICMNLVIGCSKYDDIVNFAIEESSNLDQTLISQDNPKKTYAKLSITSDKTQILKASPQSTLNGSQVSFPSGCLQSQNEITEITLEEGVNNYYEIGVGDFTELEKDNFLEYKPSLLLTSADTSLSFSCDFTISFSIDNLSLSQQKNIALFYHMYDPESEIYISGFRKVEQVDGSIEIKDNKIGAYQIVYLKNTLSENLINVNSSQQGYLPKSVSSTNDDNIDDSKIQIEQKNIIVGGGSLKGHPPTGILFDGSKDSPSVDERSPRDTVVTNLSAIDNDLNDTFVFSLSGKQKDFFYIEDNKLYVNEVFEYKDGPTKRITISVSDSFGFIYSQNILVTVNNIHPTKILLNNESQLTIDEHLDAGATIASLSVDQGGFEDSVWTYQLSGADAAYLYIDESSLKIAQEFFYINKPSLSISLSVEDNYGISFSEDFTITVNNLLPEITLTGNSVHAGKNPGVAVGTLSSNEVVTFSLASGVGDDDNEDFIIDGNSLRTSKTLSYEAGATRSIRVRATEEIYYEKIFTINIQKDEVQTEQLILSKVAGESFRGMRNLNNAWQKITNYLLKFFNYIKQCNTIQLIIRKV